MRNIDNAIKKVQSFRGNLSKTIVCSTAKQTLNQYNRGWIKPEHSHNFYSELVSGQSLDLLETPLIGRKLDKALTKQGLEWMRRFFFTSKGKRRMTQAMLNVPPRCFDIIENFSHFTFHGFIDSNGFGDLIPMWTVHSKTGDTFRYAYNGGRFNTNGGLIIE